MSINILKIVAEPERNVIGFNGSQLPCNATILICKEEVNGYAGRYLYDYSVNTPVKMLFSKEQLDKYF